MAIRNSPPAGITFLLILISLQFHTASSQADDLVPRQPETSRLADLSLSDLLQLTITSVSKKEENASEAPASVYVLTQEDIHRGGLLSVPEALRMVPGMDVARINANQWAISARGFNSRYANKLLVLMDGRSVYTPLFGGVRWDIQDPLLEDLDRIEIIRGPGATLWGADAVNGVINIISKNASDTQGALISGGGGSEDRGFGAVRYGGKINDQTYYRVYGKYFDTDDTVDAAGQDSYDAWNLFRTGFRLDWKPSSENSVTLLGDYYSGTTHESTPTNFVALSMLPFFQNDLTGGNILGRWKHSFSDASELTYQMYYDHAERRSSAFSETIDTFDIDAHHRFELGERNEVTWGLGYRLIHDDLMAGSFSTYDPDSADRTVFSAFAQDEISIVPDRLRLSLGSKFEHNQYSGLEIQPAARIAFTPRPKHTFWSAISRAVRTPSRFENDARQTILFFPGADVSTRLDLVYNRELRPEELLAYEVGYRVMPRPDVSLDLALFYNVYNNLGTFEPLPASSLSGSRPPVLIIPLQFDNGMNGETFGAEVSAKWQITDHWRTSAGYTWLKMQLHLDPSSLDTTSELAEGDSPQHQFQVRSLLDLPWNLQFDTAVYYVDRLPRQGVAGYTRLDARVGWRPVKNLDVSVGMQNLLDDRHSEFGQLQGVASTEIQRSFYGKVTWRY